MSRSVLWPTYPTGPYDLSWLANFSYVGAFNGQDRPAPPVRVEVSTWGGVVDEVAS